MSLILKLKKYKAISRLEVLNIRVSRKLKFPLDINIIGSFGMSWENWSWNLHSFLKLNVPTNVSCLQKEQ